MAKMLLKVFSSFFLFALISRHFRACPRGQNTLDTTDYISTMASVPLTAMQQAVPLKVSAAVIVI
eukprot:scaffold2384_cov143-Skeletonema_menzelii.AAC.16